jgi:hypothetical protein
LKKKKFKFFRTTTLGWGGKFAWPWRKNFSNFSAPQPLAEVENLIGLGEKNFKIFRTTIVVWGGKFAYHWKKKFQNFPHHNTWLRWKICLALQKKISKFSTPPELPEAEFLVSLV